MWLAKLKNPMRNLSNKILIFGAEKKVGIEKNNYPFNFDIFGKILESYPKKV
jgi:hypothetical protein